MNKFTGGSLFDGIGGWPLAGSKFGIDFIWSSEIETFPIEVTKRHFPNMKHLGDLTKINGADIEPVDVITFGSPCQDLSVAGKRAGLEGARSSLFMEAVRIIREMRDSTDGKYPRFAVWENVPGAFSSNKGDDFRSVLEEIAEGKIPMPKSGKWATGGMVGGNGVEIAWRVLDAQYWGVPQRRKRIFLVADFGGFCAGEILFKPESMSGYLETCGGEREGIARGVEVGVGEPSGIMGTDIYNLTTTGDLACTITSSQHKGAGASGPGVLVPAIGFKANSSIADNAPVLDECIPPLQVTSQMAVCEPIPINDKATRYKGGGDSRNNDGSGNGLGVGKPGDPMPTLTACDRHAVAYTMQSFGEYKDCGVASSMKARDAKDATDLICSVDCRNLNESEEISGTLQSKSTGGYSLNYQNPVRVGYKVRRLTPTECERLQGLPDGYTAGGSDTQRYKALGNGMAQPCADYVMQGIADVLKGGKYAS